MIGFFCWFLAREDRGLIFVSNSRGGEPTHARTREPAAHLDMQPGFGSPAQTGSMAERAEKRLRMDPQVGLGRARLLFSFLGANTPRNANRPSLASPRLTFCSDRVATSTPRVCRRLRSVVGPGTRFFFPARARWPARWAHWPQMTPPDTLRMAQPVPSLVRLCVLPIPKHATLTFRFSSAPLSRSHPSLQTSPLPPLWILRVRCAGMERSAWPWSQGLDEKGLRRGVRHSLPRLSAPLPRNVHADCFEQVRCVRSGASRVAAGRRVVRQCAPTVFVGSRYSLLRLLSRLCVDCPQTRSHCPLGAQPRRHAPRHARSCARHVQLRALV